MECNAQYKHQWKCEICAYIEFTKRPVYQTDHLVKFYFKDGWLKHELEALLIHGSIIIPFPEDATPYMTTSIDGILNEEMLKSRVSTIHREP